MKSKLNKQQKKYIKACDDKELRKVFTKFFKKENRKWIKLKTDEIVFNNGMFTTENPFIFEFLNGLTGHQFEKITETPNANTLTKETLESLTNPDLIEKQKLIESIKLTYSQEDMFKCFQESRFFTDRDCKYLKHESFASYLESLQK